MHARSLLLFVFICLSFPVFAQPYAVTGRVVDAKDTSALIGVTVMVRNTADTNQKQGTVSDADGNFRVEGLMPGSYSLRMEYLGYTVITKNFSITDKEETIGTQNMTTVTRELKGVTVADKAIRAEQKGDTSQFRADAYKTNRDASAEDLVNKMPGITSDNTGVKVNGESVQQVYVDGKPFFGTDPTLALKNLPAEVIDKIQVFDKLSDQASFTGFDDGSGQKTMNIITRRNKSEGVFGKAYAGYGTDDRYLAGGNLNIFNGDQRISILALSNNINQQNFSSQDLLGVSGSGQNRGGQGGRGSRGNFGGGGGGGGGNGAGNFLVGQQGGITTTNSYGINYSDNWGKKVKVSGSYFFNSTDNVNSTDMVRHYFRQQDTGLVYNENSRSEGKNYNHRANLRLEYNIDSFNSIIFTPGISFQNNYSTSALAAQTDSTGQKIRTTVNNTEANNMGYSSSNNLLIQHKFKKQRRTVSLNLNAALNEKSGDGAYGAYNNSFYGTGASMLTVPDTMDQHYTLYNNGYTLGGNLTYTEPVGKKGQLSVNYNPSLSMNHSDKETFSKTGGTQEYTSLIDSLSNKYTTNYNTQKGGLSYRIGDRKLNFMVGANMQYATLDGDRDFPTDTSIHRNFTSILPIAMFNVRYEDGRNLRVMYRTNTQAPSVTQLQDVADVSNTLLLKTGNLALKQDYEQTLIVRYGLTKSKTARNFFVNLYANYITDYIGNATYIPTSDSIFRMPGSANTVLIARGSQLTLPVNLNGYFTGRSFFTYGMPMDVIKCNLNLNGGFNYTHTPGLINDVVNYSDNYVPSVGLVLGSNISEKVDFTLSYSGNYNIVKNSVQTQSNNNYYSHVASAAVNLTFLKNFVFNTNISENYYTAFSNTAAQDFLLWNAYLGYKFLSNHALEARITAYDILNQNRSVSRNVTELYVENSVTQVLKQYFMLQLTYTIRNFKGAATMNTLEKENKEDHDHRPPPPPGGFPGSPMR